MFQGVISSSIIMAATKRRSRTLEMLCMKHSFYMELLYGYEILWKGYFTESIDVKG
jgi:hypothetical protein